MPTLLCSACAFSPSLFAICLMTSSIPRWQRFPQCLAPLLETGTISISSSPHHRGSGSKQGDTGIRAPAFQRFSKASVWHLSARGARTELERGAESMEGHSKALSVWHMLGKRPRRGLVCLVSSVGAQTFPLPLKKIKCKHRK